jgi:hypothetical protein
MVYLVVPEGPGTRESLLMKKSLSLGENPKILDTPIGYDGSVQDR